MLIFGTLGLLAVALLVLRLAVVFASIGKRAPKRPANGSLSTLIVLGSGGHTAEMLTLVGAMCWQRYSPRIYIAAATDNMSLTRARTAEDKAAAQAQKNGQSGEDGDPKKEAESAYLQVYRSREVGQSYVSSVGTTLIAMAHAAWLVFRIRPDLVLCNGPGTCLPICIAGFLLRLAGVKAVRLVYVESVARVQKLSLTGLLLYKLHIIDQFFVQWTHLTSKYPGTQYIGRLM